MPINQGGLGTIGWHACKALAEHRLLECIFSRDVSALQELRTNTIAPPFPFQKMMGGLSRLGWTNVYDDFFDRWVSTWLKPGYHFYGWLNQSLACIRKSHQWGGKALVDRCSVEPRLQYRWLKEEYEKYEIPTNPMTRWNLERMIQESEEADAIVVSSKIIAESYIAAGFNPSKLNVNNFGVELPPSMEQKDTSQKRPLRFVFVGMISLRKGVPGLLKAWKQLSPKNAELVLAGVIPKREAFLIEPLIRNTPNVVWNGHCSKVTDLLQQSDVLILPSAEDGFGMVVLEAFANRLPVIISDRVGAQDCVTQGENGFIVPFGCENALATKIEWFLQNPTHSQEMGRIGRQTAEKCTWKEYGERFTSFMLSQISSP